jgi:hypothetical protein
MVKLFDAMRKNNPLATEAVNRPSISGLHRELSALRNRLDETSGRFVGANLTIRIFALARDVNGLCFHASCIDVLEAEPLLTNVEQDLDELQILLGTH